MDQTTDNPTLQVTLINLQDVLKVVSDFCDQTQPFVGERFKKQLRNTIRAVPRTHAPVVAPQVNYDQLVSNVLFDVEHNSYEKAAANLKRALNASTITKIAPEFDDPPAPPEVTFHLSDGSAVRYARQDAAPASPSPGELPHEHRWVGRGEYGGTEAGYMCADCGVDLDDVDTAALRTSVGEEGK